MISRVLAAVLAVVSLVISGEPRKIQNFTLADCNGVKHSLSDYSGAKAIVLIFISTECPVSNAYNDRMVAVYNDYKRKEVVFLGINANKEETVDDIKQHARDHGFGFTILKDHNNVVADELGASVTPEVYIADSSLQLLYHGRIDDSRRESQVSSRDLRKALDEILSGKLVSLATTKAFGCTIKRMSQ